MIAIQIINLIGLFLSSCIIINSISKGDSGNVSGVSDKDDWDEEMKSDEGMHLIIATNTQMW